MEIKRQLDEKMVQSFKYMKKQEKIKLSRSDRIRVV